MRSGVPDKVPGRSVNVGERGIAAMLAGELQPGETVEVELTLSPSIEPLRANATVKYHDKLRCGFEFVEISAEQRVAIRDWAKEAKAETEVGAIPHARVNRVVVKHIPTNQSSFGGGGSSVRRRKKSRLIAWIVVLTLAAFVAGVFLWRWNRGWEELESGIKDSKNMSTAPVQVPTEAMQKLLVHRVDPIYPAEARQENLQGIIALDIVVGRDGSVVSTRALNGPDVLARAAMDALRWWKFEPYRVNGEPVTVETTVAVEFKR